MHNYLSQTLKETDVRACDKILHDDSPGTDVECLRPRRSIVLKMLQIEAFPGVQSQCAFWMFQIHLDSLIQNIVYCIIEAASEQAL